MRSKKNREVNIFSASVVDLFASGLGVFLIVAIIALVNQKKESSRALNGGLAGTVVETNSELKKIGKKSNYGRSSQMLVSDLEQKIKELKIKLENKTEQNFDLKKQLMQTNKEVKKEMADSRFDQAVKIEQLRDSEDRLIEKNAELEKTIEAQKQKIGELERALASEHKVAKLGKKGVGTNFNNFEVGSRIKLQNVHFYPGTDRAIEPYASREVRDLAVFLRKNPAVTIEISGHIYETKKAIEAGTADDEYNLSGRRAKYVCEKLEELGIKQKRMTCLGYGATRPLFLTNDQYSQEAQSNRRVEVEILTK